MSATADGSDTLILKEGRKMTITLCDRCKKGINNDASAIVNGDQDGDGNITSSDVTAVYNLLLGE